MCHHRLAFIEGTCHVAFKDFKPGGVEICTLSFEMEVCILIQFASTLESFRCSSVLFEFCHGRPEKGVMSRLRYPMDWYALCRGSWSFIVVLYIRGSIRRELGLVWSPCTEIISWQAGSVSFVLISTRFGRFDCDRCKFCSPRCPARCG